MDLIKGTRRCVHFSEAISCRGTGLGIADADKPFSVVCDASNFAIGSALMQKDDNGVDRVISYQSRLLKAAELNYPVHDKELL